MIANVTAIVYILSVSEENLNNVVLQKGTAISRIDSDDGFQIYFTYVPIRDVSHDSDDTSPDADTEIVQPLNEEAVYLISGKFSPNQDSSLNVVVTTSICLPIDKEDIPICQPIVHLLGKTLNNAELSEIGYNLNLQAKPYLSKGYFNPFIIALTHFFNGRFHNALTKAKKNSTIHATGILFSIKNNFYCESMDFNSLRQSRKQILMLSCLGS